MTNDKKIQDIENKLLDIEKDMYPDNLAKLVDSSYMFSINQIRAFLQLLAFLMAVIMVFAAYIGFLGFGTLSDINDDAKRIEKIRQELDNASRSIIEDQALLDKSTERINKMIQSGQERLTKLSETITAKQTIMTINIEAVEKELYDIEKEAESQFNYLHSNKTRMENEIKAVLNDLAKSSETIQSDFVNIQSDFANIQSSYEKIKKVQLDVNHTLKVQLEYLDKTFKFIDNKIEGKVDGKIPEPPENISITITP